MSSPSRLLPAAVGCALFAAACDSAPATREPRDAGRMAVTPDGAARDGGALVPATDAAMFDAGTDGSSATLDAGRIEVDAQAPPPVEPTVPCADEPLRTTPFAGPYVDRVTAYYLTPTDEEPDLARARYFACSLRRAQEFYRAALGRSFTFVLATLPARHPRAWYQCEGEATRNTCVERVRQDLVERGLPVYSPRTLFAVALQGNSIAWNGGRADGSDGGGFCVIGPELYRDMIDRGCRPGECRSRLWNSEQDGDAVAGGLAHELGHAFGLPHPPENAANRGFSVMAEHWHFPRNGFLPFEAQALRTNPLFVP